MSEFAQQDPRPKIDWEGFYGNYRKPGYIPGFEIINKLGGGVFGLVYKARKESIGKDYAIKFLKVDDEVVRDAVVRELDTVRFFAQIDHPNLVSIEDKGEVDGIPFIIMSYAGEETLRKRLETGDLSREDALKLFIQAARGIQALHDHSLVHFDLKPANIFLRGDIARVGDYGLSKLVTESRNSLSFGRGTPYYMAPEMLQRRGDARSDIYSLGVILFECLTGDVPFKGDSEWEVLRKHETAEPDYPASMGATERRVLARCLAKDPEERYQSVSDLLHDLQAPATLGESMVIPPHRPATPPPAEDAPRPSTPAAAAAAASQAAHQAAAEAQERVQAFELPERPTGPIGGLVHLVFNIFEFAVLMVLVPIRVLSMVVGRGLVFLFQFPAKVLGVTLSVAGYLFILLLLVLFAMTLMSLVVG